MADIGHLGFRDDFEAADFMLDEVGVSSVPGSSFYHRAELGRSMLRFTFSKSDETIGAAAERLKSLSEKLARRRRSLIAEVAAAHEHLAPYKHDHEREH